jgi:hypothetical protein
MVVVTPPSAAVTTGSNTQFQATTMDAAGNTLAGRPVTWASSNPGVATVSASGLATGVTVGSSTISATAEGKNGQATLTVMALAPPGTVNDLSAAVTSDSSGTLSFTEVSDGTGHPASYDVRFSTAPISWGSAGSVVRGTCATPLAGTLIGAKRSCTVLGLAPATTYNFQMIAFRGTMNLNAIYGGLSNVAAATTVATAATVASVVVNPSSASLTVGSVVQLSGVARDQNGVAISGKIIQWSSSSSAIATVTATGLVTGVAVGNATILATCDGITGSAAIIVYTSSGTSSAHPHEPGGYVSFAEHAFAVLPSGTNGRSGFWYNTGGPNLSLQLDAGSPESPPSVIQTRFPAGFVAGSEPVNFGGWDGANTQKSRVYISFWLKILGSDYENQSVGTKMGFIGYSRDPSSALNDGFFFLPGGGIQSAFNFEFRQQNNVNRNLTQNVTSAKLMTVGSWHHAEAVLELNTLGVPNGTFRMWIDGNQTHDYTDVTYIVPGATTGFLGWKFAPTWGGIGGAKTRDDFMQIDHVYISGVN